MLFPKTQRLFDASLLASVLLAVPGAIWLADVSVWSLPVLAQGILYVCVPSLMRTLTGHRAHLIY